MRNIFRVTFVSVIFDEPKASEICKQKRREKYFHIARICCAITNYILHESAADNYFIIR